MNVVQGGNAAELSAINVLSQIVHVGGIRLEDVKRILKLTVLVASTPDFTEQHLVANGASNLLVAVLGDKGRHARAAFGVAALPLGAAVEIEAVVEV
jgi:enamine deaminase RidA (YjgF/YER057c/UK114 family)